MASLVDVIREKQARMDELRRELTQLEAEMQEARSVLLDRPSDRRAKAKSRHGFKDGIRRRPIQKGSSIWWTLQLLEEVRRPLRIEELLAGIERKGGGTVKKATLASNLSRYIQHNDTFTRPAPNTYGLVDYPVYDEDLPPSCFDLPDEEPPEQR